MKLFNKVAIIGVGLIGGSLGLALKKKRIAKKVVGVSRHKQTLALAKKMGAIDEGSLKLDVIKGSDFLIFATPVNTIINLAPRAAKIIGRECMVTDVGSTKEKIVSVLEKIFPLFVGSHPLAGSEKRSVKNAEAAMFENSLCILTPTNKTRKEVLNKVKKLWASVGAKAVSIPLKTHDRVLSITSHLPHILAFSLISCVPLKFLNLSGQALKDTTRIAASDPLLWSDIIVSNQRNILNSLKSFKFNLSQLERAVRNKDRKKILTFLKASKKKRERLSSDDCCG